MAQSPAGGRLPQGSLQFDFFMTWTMGQSAPSANLQITQSWKEWHQGTCCRPLRPLRLEKWADKKLMKFNKGNCKVLPLWRNTPRHQYTLVPTGWKAVCHKSTWGSW